MASLPQIKVSRLRVELCGSDKMPLDFCGNFTKHLYDTYGNDLGEFCIVVNKGQGLENGRRKSTKHRIFVGCPHCDKLLPVGRLQQHRKSTDPQHKPRDYRYLTCKVLSNGLLLKLTKEGRAQLKYWQELHPEWNDTTLFYELAENMLGNGWESIIPEEIGALTSCPIILSDDIQRNDNGEITALGRIFWHESYAIQLACEALHSKSGLYLALASEYGPSVQNAYQDGIRAHNSKEAREVPNPYKQDTKLALAWRRGWLAASRFATTAVDKLLSNS